MIEKKTLRAKLKEILCDLKYEEKSFAEKEIVIKLERLLRQHRPQTIGVYAPLKDEVNLEEFLVANQELTAFPKFLDDGCMGFVKASFDELELSSEFGVEILSPVGSEFVNPEILLIPGLGFDFRNNRLGRGKGFYDRYLKGFKGLKIGVCFKSQIVEQIPCEEHDIKMDMIISND